MLTVLTDLMKQLNCVNVQKMNFNAMMVIVCLIHGPVMDLKIVGQMQRMKQLTYVVAL